VPAGSPICSKGRRQLILYHFMFDPSWEKGCSGCTAFADALGDLSLMAKKDTTFAMVIARPAGETGKYTGGEGMDRDLVLVFGSDFKL